MSPPRNPIFLRDRRGEACNESEHGSRACGSHHSLSTRGPRKVLLDTRRLHRPGCDTRPLGAFTYGKIWDLRSPKPESGRWYGHNLRSCSTTAQSSPTTGAARRPPTGCWRASPSRSARTITTGLDAGSTSESSVRTEPAGWAEARATKTVGAAGVVGSVVQLGNCFDLLDTRYASDLAAAYELWAKALRDAKVALPKNDGSDPDRRLRRRDCALINWHKF